MFLNEKNSTAGMQTCGRKVIDKVFRYIDPQQEFDPYVNSIANIILWRAGLMNI